MAGLRTFGAWVLVALMLVIGLSACGGSHHSVAAPKAPSASPYAQVVPGHPCDPKSFYMQCQSQAAGQFPQSSPLDLRAGFSSQFGIDFAWGGPSGWVARSLGARFGVSYLSGTSKDWHYSKLQSYKAAGLGIGFVWETTQYRPYAGCGGGYSDAQRANSEARALGFPTAPVFFAVDFDTSGFSSSGVVGQYFHCAKNVLGSRAGVYGGLRTIQIAAAQGIPANRRWQTLAWSYGRWTSACLRQYAIDRGWHGYNVDYNLAVCQDWGQVNGAPPPPPPDPYRFYAKPNRHFAHGVVASEYNAVKTWDKYKCTNPVQRTVCKTTKRDLGLLSGRVYYLATHPRTSRHLPHWEKPNSLQSWGHRYAGMTHRINGK